MTNQTVSNRDSDNYTQLQNSFTAPEFEYSKARVVVAGNRSVSIINSDGIWMDVLEFTLHAPEPKDLPECLVSCLNKITFAGYENRGDLECHVATANKLRDAVCVMITAAVDNNNIGFNIHSPELSISIQTLQPDSRLAYPVYGGGFQAIHPVTNHGAF